MYNRLCFFLLTLFTCILIHSCSKDDSIQNEVRIQEKTEIRTSSSDPFLDLMFTHDTLNLGVTRGGFYQFVNQYRIDISSRMSSGSFFDFFKQQNIYPCWYCGESEYLDFDNYYVPFYDLSNGRLDGVLVLQEKSGVRNEVYVAHSMVDQIVSQRTEPYSQYWYKIMNYFDGGPTGKDKKDHFSSRKPGCFETGHVQKTCVCEGSGEDCTIYDIPLDPNDPVVPDCLPACFELGDPGGGTINEDGGPLEIADIKNWIDNDDDTGGGGGSSSDETEPIEDWDDFCGGFNGTLGTASTDPTPNEDGTWDISLLPNPEELYLQQIENFLKKYGLQSQYTPKELKDIIGEQCAVSNISNVHACIKCHFISPLGLSDADNWTLAGDFNIVADCESNNKTNCIECSLAIEDFEKEYGLSLSENHKDELLAAIQPSLCGDPDHIAALYFSNTDNPRRKLCAESVQAVKLTEPEVEAWYFKMLDFNYNFAYTDPTNPSFTRIFNVGFGDLCVNAYNGVITGEGAAEVAFAKAFEFAVTQTTNLLNNSPWDDIQMQFGGGMTIEAYISVNFRSYLELNLQTLFFGSPNTSTSPCNGVQGFVPVYRLDC